MALIIVHHLDQHIVVVGIEAGQSVGHPQRREGGGTAQRQGTPGAGVKVLADAIRGLGDVDEGELCRIEEDGAGRGQRDRPPGPPERGVPKKPSSSRTCRLIAVWHSAYITPSCKLFCDLLSQELEN